MVPQSYECFLDFRPPKRRIKGLRPEVCGIIRLYECAEAHVAPLDAHGYIRDSRGTGVGRERYWSPSVPGSRLLELQLLLRLPAQRVSIRWRSSFWA